MVSPAQSHNASTYVQQLSSSRPRFILEPTNLTSPGTNLTYTSRSEPFPTEKTLFSAEINVSRPTKYLQSPATYDQNNQLHTPFKTKHHLLHLKVQAIPSQEDTSINTSCETNRSQLHVEVDGDLSSKGADFTFSIKRKPPLVPQGPSHSQPS